MTPPSFLPGPVLCTALQLHWLHSEGWQLGVAKGVGCWGAVGQGNGLGKWGLERSKGLIHCGKWDGGLRCKG